MKFRITAALNGAIKNKRKYLLVYVSKKEQIIIKKLISLGIIKYIKTSMNKNYTIKLTNKALNASRTICIKKNSEVELRW